MAWGDRGQIRSPTGRSGRRGTGDDGPPFQRLRESERKPARRASEGVPSPPVSIFIRPGGAALTNHRCELATDELAVTLYPRVTPTAKKSLSRLLKLAVCAGALWYLSDKVSFRDYVRLAEAPAKTLILLRESPDTLRVRDPADDRERDVPRSSLARPDQLQKGWRDLEPGLLSIARRADWRWTGWSLLAMGPSIFIMAWRLRLLLTVQHIPLSLRDATLLTFAGNFFNFAMPGTTGGDLYKAYHIAVRTSKRAEGVTIVLLDRIIGLISFLLIATGGILVLAALRKEMIGVYGRWVGWLMVAFMVGTALYFSRRVRRWFRFDALLTRLPLADKLRRIDETTFSFRWHPWATAASLLATLLNHFLIIASVYCLAHALGIEPRNGRTEGELFMACLLCTTVGFLFAAIPISFQGFGLFEAVFYRVLVEGGWCTPSQMLALTVGMRLVQIIWSLPGIVVPWLGFARPTSIENEVPAAPHRDPESPAGLPPSSRGE